MSKIFPFTGEGPSENFFPSLNMYQAKSSVKNFSLYWGGGGGFLLEIFFPSLNMYQAKSGVKKFSLYWGGGPSSNFFFFSSLNMYQAKSGVQNFSLYWCPPSRPWLDWDPPPPPPRLDWVPPPSKAGSGSPPKCEQTETITFPHPSDGGR